MSNQDNANPAKETVNQIYKVQIGFKSFMSQIMGIIVAIGGMLAAFLVSLLSDLDGSADIGDKVKDPYFWIVWAIIFAIALMVAITTYRLTKREAKEGEEFKEARTNYLEAKKKVMPNIDLVPYFCVEKNDEIYKIIEREIVESADLIYELYKKGHYNVKELERYQRKRLKKIKKIKIKRLRAKNLTQETDSKGDYKYSFLPQSEESNERVFLLTKSVSKAVNTFVFLVAGSLTFTMMGWVSAVINSFGILMTWVGAILSAYDFVNTTLIIEYVAKTDLLNELDDNVPKYRAERFRLAPETIKEEIDIKVQDDEEEPKTEELEVTIENENADTN